MKKTRTPETLILPSKIEAREVGGQRHLVGVIPYNSMSQEMFFGFEVIRPGAFAKTIQEQDIRALWNHSNDKVLGRTGNQTLTLTDSEEGLVCDVALPATTYADDAWASASRADSPNMSFTFAPIRTSSAKTPSGAALSELLEVRLTEVSYGVPWAAYPATNTVALMRSWNKRGVDLEAITAVIDKDKTALTEEDKVSLRNAVQTISAMLEEPQAQPPKGTEAPAPVPTYDEVKLDLI